MNPVMNRSAEPRHEPSAVETITALLGRVASGDRDSLSELYRRTSAKLYGICLGMVGNQSDAEDVLQDVYVTIWRNAGRFDSSKASPITWLSVVARNKSIDRLRRRRAPSAGLDEAEQVEDDDPSAFDVLDQAMEAERLAGCLGELEERPRAMIRAAFLDGATYSELAERESVPLGTMKSWIRRALLRLRGCLER